MENQIGILRKPWYIFVSSEEQINQYDFWKQGGIFIKYMTYLPRNGSNQVIKYSRVMGQVLISQDEQSIIDSRGE